MDIILADPIETILDKNEKHNLMNVYHSDPLLGSHCGRKKLGKAWKQRKLFLTPTPIKSFDIVVLDTIGPFDELYNGKKYATTLICDLLKYLVTIVIPDKKYKYCCSSYF